MPVPVVAKVGVIALSVAVAAAIAVYESPELQRMANDLRRRIAIALHALGDSVTPQERENLFNRPEDAEGFFRSRGVDINGDMDVDADDETRRRQREEIMYWNALREEKKTQESSDPEKVGGSRPRGSSFDDFLREDGNAEKGTYVFQTGLEARNNEGLLRRRGDGARGLSQSIYTNPFSDEHGIDGDIAFENSLMDPEKDEIESDIYSASTQLGIKDNTPPSATLLPSPAITAAAATSETPLVDTDDHPSATRSAPAEPSERELGPDEYMTAGQEDSHDAYSSIQAWAHDASTASFYSPLPVSPAEPMSEPELVSDGMLTPTDSASLAGSGEDIGEAVSAVSWSGSRHYDVMSDDEGMMTPASWTEVGSVVSESEAGVAGAVHH
ncbi:uncharacterized protein GGS22DRAFT_168687 [Annulohypoxylon maeteangense]|uniref:uncharacterized protein n=1 Tax=Annulohypoxylon maeteangense TaxID=1927788 RepID=UPI0020073B3B|nr:uncharacterized protein GGS22DRAFT_168687 [Annulohypoxylon maeteangense]KAI0882770.1 hypothetical protein GGS22DRAFT_168687 [Annulohypoxylon maeteangense]